MHCADHAQQRSKQFNCLRLTFSNEFFFVPWSRNPPPVLLAHTVSLASAGVHRILLTTVNTFLPRLKAHSSPTLWASVFCIWWPPNVEGGGSTSLVWSPANVEGDSSTSLFDDCCNGRQQQQMRSSNEDVEYANNKWVNEVIISEWTNNKWVNEDSKLFLFEFQNQ